MIHGKSLTPMTRGNASANLVRARRSPARDSERETNNDQAAEEILRTLEGNKRNLKNLNAVIKRSLLKLPASRHRKFLGGILDACIPERFYPVIPDAVMSLISENKDVLEYIEISQRTCLNGIQDSLRELAATLAQKSEELSELKRDVETASAEHWNARRLQSYVAEQSGIEVYDEVARLLDKEFYGLSESEKEACKEEILDGLNATIQVGKPFIAMLEKVVSAGLRTFHAGQIGYYQYVKFYRSVAVVRDAAAAITGTDRAMYAGGAALVMTVENAINAIDGALEGARLLKNFSVASPSMQDVLEAGRARLEQRLALIAAEREERSRAKLIEIETAEKTIPEPEVIEVEILES